jgi:alpha-glucosidase
VIYEIAVISFQDSDGDGKGDLPGLIGRVGYLEWLGVDAVWLTPIYPSPMLDFGYDVSDFCAVHRLLGTMADFDRLVETLHRRNIRLILDFVPNHTSDTHPWFDESRASRHNPKCDWYLWAEPGPDGGPPNNWLSRFGGSAWRWDERRQQYYYHAFLLEQPDLNWRNPEVRRAMAEVLRFWLRKGVDGFRVDASAVLIEDELLRDDPPDPEAAGRPPPQRLKRIFTDDRPEAMTCIEEMRSTVDEFEDRVLAGEVQGEMDRIGHFYSENGHERFQLPLNFALVDSSWDALSLQGVIDAYLRAIPEKAWPDWVIGGHDKRRMASKIGQSQSRILAMLIMTLRGTAILFAGDELGAERVPIPQELVQDPFEKLVPGYGLDRDPERAPIRWDASPAGGFTDGEPWLPLDREERNVEALQADEHSLLWLYRWLIRLRRSERALVSGEQKPMRSRNDILLYTRRLGADELLVALNLVHQPRRLDWKGEGTLLLSTHLDRKEERLTCPTLLRPDEGIILKLRR